MKPIEVTKGIYWVGAIDWNVRDFHGYSTYQGTTYNAYLVMDEKITLIDTVKKEFVEQMFQRISHLIDPKKIDQVISNHTEMDHSGGLPWVMHRIGENKPLYCSKVGFRNLTNHFKQKWNYQPVENGGEMSLGKRTVTFLETRMLHWPDSMFTYVKEDRLLFSSDAFGAHYASNERFDDQVADEDYMPHALKYYANIILPYSALVLKLVEKVQGMELPLDFICPDHGIIWRKDPGRIINTYVQWAKQEPRRKAVVIYDTMWHSTELMAEAIVEALGEAGVEAKLMHARSCHRSDIITELHDAGAILVGSPTLNNGMFPTIADVLCYMKGLKPQNKVAAAFGSHGWSGEATKLVQAELEGMKFKIIDPAVKSEFVPFDEALAACRDLARKVADSLPAA